MNYNYAKQLHNNDQITVKETGEVTEVISVEVLKEDVFLYAMTRNNGYTKLHHTEIR